MMRAKLKGNFYIAELYDDCSEIEEIVKFKKGMIVEVLKEGRFEHDLKQFIIYSEELNESTTVQEGLLEFLED